MAFSDDEHGNFKGHSKRVVHHHEEHVHGNADAFGTSNKFNLGDLSKLKAAREHTEIDQQLLDDQVEMKSESQYSISHRSGRRVRRGKSKTGRRRIVKEELVEEVHDECHAHHHKEPTCGHSRPAISYNPQIMSSESVMCEKDCAGTTQEEIDVCNCTEEIVIEEELVPITKKRKKPKRLIRKEIIRETIQEVMSVPKIPLCEDHFDMEVPQPKTVMFSFGTQATTPEENWHAMPLGEAHPCWGEAEEGECGSCHELNKPKFKKLFSRQKVTSFSVMPLYKEDVPEPDRFIPKGYDKVNKPADDWKEGEPTRHVIPKKPVFKRVAKFMNVMSFGIAPIIHEVPDEDNSVWKGYDKVHYPANCYQEPHPHGQCCAKQPVFKYMGGCQTEEPDQGPAYEKFISDRYIKPMWGGASVHEDCGEYLIHQPEWIEIEEEIEVQAEAPKEVERIVEKEIVYVERETRKKEKKHKHHHHVQVVEHVSDHHSHGHEHDHSHEEVVVVEEQRSAPRKSRKSVRYVEQPVVYETHGHGHGHYGHGEVVEYIESGHGHSHGHGHTTEVVRSSGGARKSVRYADGGDRRVSYVDHGHGGHSTSYVTGGSTRYSTSGVGMRTSGGSSTIVTTGSPTTKVIGGSKTVTTTNAGGTITNTTQHGTTEFGSGDGL